MTHTRARKIVHAANDRLCGARRVVAWLQNLRLSRIAVVVLGHHVSVRHLVASSSQQRRTRKLECEGVSDGTFIGRLGCCPADGERRIGTVTVWRRLHAPPDREAAATGLQTQHAVVGARDANGRAFVEARKSALQAKCFTEYPLCCSLSVT